MAHHLGMGEIGRGNDDRITRATLQQVFIALEHFGGRCGGCQQRRGQRTALGVGVGQSGDDGPVERAQVFNVFTAHAAATDDAVAKGFHCGVHPFKPP